MTVDAEIAVLRTDTLVQIHKAICLKIHVDSPKTVRPIHRADVNVKSGGRAAPV